MLGHGRFRARNIALTRYGRSAVGVFHINVVVYGTVGNRKIRVGIGAVKFARTRTRVRVERRRRPAIFYLAAVVARNTADVRSAADFARSVGIRDRSLILPRDPADVVVAVHVLRRVDGFRNDGARGVQPDDPAEVIVAVVCAALGVSLREYVAGIRRARKRRGSALRHRTVVHADHAARIAVGGFRRALAARQVVARAYAAVVRAVRHRAVVHADDAAAPDIGGYSRVIRATGGRAHCAGIRYRPAPAWKYRPRCPRWN